MRVPSGKAVSSFDLMKNRGMARFHIFLIEGRGLQAKLYPNPSKSFSASRGHRCVVRRLPRRDTGSAPAADRHWTTRSPGGNMRPASRTPDSHVRRGRLSPGDSHMAPKPTEPPADLLRLLRDYQVLTPEQLDETARLLQPQCAGPRELAHELIRRGWLTPYQARRLFRGRGRELLLGPYLLLGRLGEGGVGQVLKARHRQTGEVVALKLLRPERLARRNGLPRFRREVRAAARLRHPHVVAARGAGVA